MVAPHHHDPIPPKFDGINEIGGGILLTEPFIRME